MHLPALSAPPLPARSPGWTLLETLVAIAVAGLGLLGALALQTAALHSLESARWQAAAAQLAHELSETLQANAALSPDTRFSPADALPASSVAAPACGIPGRPACTSAQAAAERDLALWWSRVHSPALGGLPLVRAVLCWDAAPTTTPQWDCQPQGRLLTLKLGWESVRTRPHPKANGDAPPAPRLVWPMDVAPW